MDEQLLRVSLPTSLLVELDQHLRSEGSARTRGDFVRESIEQRLLELRLGDVEAPPTVSEGRLPGARLPQPPLASEDDDLSEDPLLDPRSLVDTRLPEPAGATVAHPDAEGFPTEPGPLFLHGRDYPSFWCLSWLTRWADESPLELNAYLNEITVAAWRFADNLRELYQAGNLKASTTFPTSTRNPDSASQTFQASAIGGLVRRRDGSKVVVGPLALWGVARIYPFGEQAVIAPTELGLDLLRRLEGLSLELPHAAEHAEVFFSHLREHAPADHEAFLATLRAVAENPNRDELFAALTRAGLAESEKLVDVYAQSYVARGREWGLIEPKLAERRYRLTERGRSFLDG